MGSVQCAMLPTVQFRILVNDKHTGVLRAICDTGSQINLITKDIIKKFNIPTKSIKLAIDGIASQKSAVSNQLIEGEICDRHSHATGQHAQFVAINHITANMPTGVIDRHVTSGIDSHQLADDTYNYPEVIHAIFGAGLMAEIAEDGYMRLPNHYMAMKTALGYAIMGGLDDNDHRQCLMAIVDNDHDLDAALKKL